MIYPDNVLQNFREDLDFTWVHLALGLSNACLDVGLLLSLDTEAVHGLLGYPLTALAWGLACLPVSQWVRSYPDYLMHHGIPTKLSENTGDITRGKYNISVCALYIV